MLRNKLKILCIHSSKVRICILIAALSVFASSAAQAVDPSDGLLTRFRNETPQAWKRNESADELPGTFKVTTKILTYSGEKLTKTEEKSARLRRKAGYYLFEPLESRDGGSVITGKNPHYYFRITKGDGKDDCTLSELRTKGQKGFGGVPADLFQYLKPNSYGFIPSQGDLPKLVDSRRFNIMRAEEVDPQLIRLYFRIAIDIPRQPAEQLKGWMDFDPNNAWALKGIMCEISDSTFKLIKDFSSSKHDSFSPCKSWETIQGPKEGQEWKQIQRTQFEIIDPSVPPDDIFTLSHFGLPEPMGVSSPERPRTWIWLIAAMVAASALAILFAWLKRRWARRVAVQSTMPVNRSVT